MDFSLIDGGECDRRACVLARGEIDRDSTPAFAAFANRLRLQEGAIVFLSSIGGDHLSGIKLGQEIRRRGLDTFVDDYGSPHQSFVGAVCASACFYAFMGGVHRGLGLESRLGVHQVAIPADASPRDAISNAQWFMGLAAVHLQQMGASPDVIGLALRIPPQSVGWLSRIQMRSYRVTTSDTDILPVPKGVLNFFTATE
jgi:hypothetical protein